MIFCVFLELMHSINLSVASLVVKTCNCELHDLVLLFTIKIVNTGFGMCRLLPIVQLSFYYFDIVYETAVMQVRIYLAGMGS